MLHGHSGTRRKLLEKLSDVGLAVVPVFGKRLHDRLAHVLGHVGIGAHRFLERLGLRSHVLGRPLPRGLGVEGESSRQHLVDHDGKRVHVATSIQGLPSELLGTHVGRRAKHHALLSELLFLLGVCALGASGDAEVEHFGEVFLASALGEHDVLWLEVAVDHALLVRFLECTADLTHYLHDAVRGEWPLLLNHVTERSPRDELHRDVQRAITGRAKVVHLDGVRVLQLRDCAAFPMETGKNRGILREVRMQGLDRNLAHRAAHGLFA